MQKQASSSRKVEEPASSELATEENQLIADSKPQNMQSFNGEEGFHDLPPIETRPTEAEPDYTTRKELEDLIASYPIKEDWKVAFTCVLGLSLKDFYSKFFDDNAQYGADVYFEEKGEKKIEL